MPHFSSTDNPRRYLLKKWGRSRAGFQPAAAEWRVRNPPYKLVPRNIEKIPSPLVLARSAAPLADGASLRLDEQPADKLVSVDAPIKPSLNVFSQNY